MENSQANKERQQQRQQELNEEQVIQNRRNGDKDQFKQTANLKEEGDNTDNGKK